MKSNQHRNTKVDRKSILLLTLIMGFTTLAVGGIAIGLLYQTAYEQQRHQLREEVQSQARLVESVAHFDSLYSRNDHPDGPFSATMSQIRAAHERYEQTGNSSSFLIGQKQGDQIRFLLHHQMNTTGNKKPVVPWDSNIAEPMRRALMGESGIMEGRDLFGNMVLAAYEPVAILNLGMVAKVDLAEFRAPFIKAGFITLLIAVAIITLGTIIFRRVGSGIIRALGRQATIIEKSRKSLARAQKIAHVGNWEWDITTGELSWSDEIFRIFGLEPQSFVPTYGALLDAIHPNDREAVRHAVSLAIEQNLPYKIEHRIVRPDGSLHQVLERGEVSYNDTGEAVHMTGTVMDITERTRIEEMLKKSEEQMRSLLMSTGEAIYGIDLDGNCTFANDACAWTLGYSDASELLGKNMHELAHHSHANGNHYPQEECQIYQAFRMGNGTHVSDEVFWRPNGESFPVEYHSEPIIQDGKVTGAVVSFSDISERKRAEERLLLSDRVFRNTSEAIIITTPNGEIIEVNPAFEDITGWKRDEIIGQNPRIMKSDRQDPSFYKTMWQHIHKHGWWSGEIWDRKKSGEEYPKWLTINAVKDADKKITHYIGIFSDISKAKATEQQLQQMAFYDTLTGLPNRTLCRERMEQELKNARRQNSKVALLFLDLDRFKDINDSLGHSAGDLLLVQAAQRLRHCVRETDTVARLGGDEFNVILGGIENPQASQRIAEKIIECMADPFIIQGHEINMGASIGISLYPDNGTDYDTLSKSADTAMYKAKEAGRNTYRFFTDELQAAIKRRLLLEKELRIGLRQDNGLSLHYQPKVNMQTGHIVGMEALLRWNHPKLGTISPSEIIPIAEDTGLILLLGEWVLNQACQQNATWIRNGHMPVRMAVNLSNRQFEQKGLAESIQSILKHTGLDPEHLELEITESMVMRDADKAIVALNRLRQLGIQIAMDDFGTGYSSLSYLKQLPIHSLKIDKSFVDDIGKSDDAATIASTIISMAGRLGVKVVAEGIETKEQMEYLRNEGCDEMQGYYYSRPLPASDFIRLLDEQKKPSNVMKFKARKTSPSQHPA
jgi:diguanylate cyclase (GGDEF)-like protein/PAS domain S-box-containing protein